MSHWIYIMRTLDKEEVLAAVFNLPMEVLKEFSFFKAIYINGRRLL